MAEMDHLQPPQGQGKRARNTYDKKEKEIFLSILKNSEGGKFWKIIIEGTAKAQTRHDVWLKVTELFNNSTGRRLDFKQIKAMWLRIKDNTKKKHDSAAVTRQKEFNRSCALTGGGAPPEIPLVEDGDQVDLNLNDLEPLHTEYNQLVRPEDRIFSVTPGQGTRPPSAPGCPSSSSSGPQISPPPPGLAFRFQADSNPFRFPTPGRGRAAPSIRIASTPTRHNRPPLSLTIPGSFQLTPHSSLGSQTPVTGIRSIPSPSLFGSQQESELPGAELEPQLDFSSDLSTAETPPPVSSSANHTGDRQVLIVNENGGHVRVEADSESPRVARRPNQKKNVNEETANYYSRMREIQEELAAKKMTVLDRKIMLLKRKERNEILKEKILMRTLRKEGGVTPDTEEDEDDQSDESDDSNEDRNVVLFVSQL